MDLIKVIVLFQLTAVSAISSTMLAQFNFEMVISCKTWNVANKIEHCCLFL